MGVSESTTQIKLEMPARTSRWETTPSVLSTRSSSTINNDPLQAAPILSSNPIAAKPVEVAVTTSEYKGSKRASRFDAPTSSAPVSAPSSASESENIQPVGISSAPAPAPTRAKDLGMKVDLLENKGGEAERAAYQQQLENMKQQRDRAFMEKLESIKNAVPAASESSSINTDPYNTTGGGEGNT